MQCPSVEIFEKKYGRSRKPICQKMAELLIEMNRERKKQQEEGKSSFHEERVSEYEKRYMELIQKGCERE